MSNLKMLVTGGPVHAHLDDVKVITNVFKGGLMALLADTLHLNGVEVTYLCSRSAKRPRPTVRVVTHDGFDDYRSKVLELAPQMDAVVLGAAVANLIPAQRIHGKFPSHHYTVGQEFPIMFKIAPRVIDEVRSVAPKAKLFGFKLLSGVPHDELITAAYGVLRSSGAVAVIANDTEDLTEKFIVTKERSEIHMDMSDLPAWLMAAAADEYYSTSIHPYADVSADEGVLGKFHRLVAENSARFTATPEGLVFGSVSVRAGKGFVTTSRGKTELGGWSLVHWVNHVERKVQATTKASLNAPLVSWVMNRHERVDHVLHFHDAENRTHPELPVVKYAPPGTVRDTERDCGPSFNIENHGCILSYDKEGRLLTC